jgi:hypothetical protein
MANVFVVEEDPPPPVNSTEQPANRAMPVKTVKHVQALMLAQQPF